MFTHINHFCLIWKSKGISFNQAIKNELKPYFKAVDNVISDKVVTSFNKNEYKPKKVQSPQTNTVASDLETLNKIRAVPFCSCINKLSKISVKYHRDLSEQEYQKCLNDCVILKGTDCFKDMIMFYRSREKLKSQKKIVESNIYLIANNGIGFDSYILLNNLPQWRSVVKLNKNGAGILSLKIVNGYVDEKKFLNMSISDVGEYILKRV